MFPTAPVPAAPTVPRTCLAWQPGPAGLGQGCPGHVGRDWGDVGGRGEDEEGRDVSPGHRGTGTASGMQSQAGKCRSAGRAALGAKGPERWLWRVAGLEALHRACSPFPASSSMGLAWPGSHQPLEGTPHGRPGDASARLTGCLARRAELCS